MSHEKDLQFTISLCMTHDDMRYVIPTHHCDTLRFAASHVILMLMLILRFRCEFELTESGDVNWYPAEPASTLAKNLPLFKCRTFEVLREREGLSVVINLRFGAYRGHILEFRVCGKVLLFIFAVQLYLHLR